MTAAMANAAFSSLAAQASITLINNKGDVGKTLKELGSSQTVKATLTAMITAGVLDQLGTTATMKSLSSQTGFSEKLTYNLINATGRALTNTAINGGNLEDALKQALVGGLVDTAHGQAASQIKGLENQYLAHKLAHALAGCVAGAAAGGTCKDGAVGGAVGEIVAGMFETQRPGMFASEAEKQTFNNKVLAYSKLVSGAVSAYAGGNAQTAITTAETAVRNNFLAYNKYNSRASQWGSFKQELDTCKATAGCDVNGVYTRWTAISNDQQKQAMASMTTYTDSWGRTLTEKGNTIVTDWAKRSQAYMLNTAAKGVLTGASSSSDWWTIAALGLSGEAYQYWVGRNADVKPGVDRGDPAVKLEKEGDLYRLPRETVNGVIREGKNIGLNENPCLSITRICHGTPISNALNTLPGFNAFATLHDGWGEWLDANGKKWNIGVASRMIVWTLDEQMRMGSVPVLQGSDGGFALEC